MLGFEAEPLSTKSASLALALPTASAILRVTDDPLEAGSADSRAHKVVVKFADAVVGGPIDLHGGNRFPVWRSPPEQLPGYRNVPTPSKLSATRRMAETAAWPAIRQFWR